MTSATHWPERLWHFLVVELADFPGRGNALLRNLVACTLVILLAMTLEVPLLALSLIIVFFVSQANVVLTRMVGILFMVSATLAIGIAILLLKFTYGYPLLRILCASAVFIASLFLMRATRLGPLFFVVAIVTIYVQSLVDRIVHPELLLRACLYVWVAVVYPILVTLLVNTLLLPQEPQQQLRDAIHRQLEQVEARLAALAAGRFEEARISVAHIQQGALSLHKLLKFAIMRDSHYRADESRQLRLITCVSRLFAACAAIDAPPLNLQAVAALRTDCRSLSQVLGEGVDIRPPTLLSTGLDRTLAPAALAEMRDALQSLARHEVPTTPPASRREPLLASDAFTNPNYLRFAFKTWLATLLCYVFYNAVDWPGIHTVMLTCVIIALPSLGASTQKGFLRIGGCLVGSALALGCIVFVLPRIDDIVGLLAMSLPVIGLGAWVAAGSERISYAGLQIMFCFALALLEQFAPSTDLTEIRDRLIGVLLGVLVSTLVHGLLWPEGESDSLRRKLADALQGVAELLGTCLPEADEPVDRLHALSLRCWGRLEECQAMLVRVALEPALQQGEHEELTLFAQTLLAKTREMLLLAGQVQRKLGALCGSLTSEQWRQLENQRVRLAEWLREYATYLSGSSAAPQVHPAVGSASVGIEDLTHDLNELQRLLASLPNRQDYTPGHPAEAAP